MMPGSAGKASWPLSFTEDGISEEVGRPVERFVTPPAVRSSQQRWPGLTPGPRLQAHPFRGGGRQEIPLAFAPMVKVRFPTGKTPAALLTPLRTTTWPPLANLVCGTAVATVNTVFDESGFTET